MMPVATVAYADAVGPYTMTLGARINVLLDSSSNRYQYLYGLLSVPVYRKNGYRALAGLDVGAMVSTWIGFSQYGLSAEAVYTWQQRTVAKDFFGAGRFDAAFGTHAYFSPSFAPVFQPYAELSLQIPLVAHQILEMQVIGTAISEETLDTTAGLPDGSVESVGTGDARASFRVGYDIPLGLLDQPVPYGGMTGLGLELSLLAVCNRIQSDFVWDDDIYAGARLSADFLFGSSSSSVRPFMGVTVGLSSGSLSWFIGLDGALFARFSRMSVAQGR